MRITCQVRRSGMGTGLLLALAGLAAAPVAPLQIETTAVAADAPAAAAAPVEASRFDFREITLDNGLRLITLEDFSAPLVNVQLWYHVGSKDEQPERQGFAHMFEHMMFRGTDRLGPTDHMDYIRRVGGVCNAYTSFDQTVYHQTLPAHQLELALWLEAERMAFLKIDQSAFDTERKVVEEERRMGLNRPYGSLFEKVMGEVFHEHPYRWTPIGKIPHLRSSEVPELRKFWTDYYVPNNATLVIVGAVKHAEAEQLVRRTFGWIPRREPPPRVSDREPVPDAFREITINEDNAPAPLVGAIYRAPQLDDPDRVPLELLLKIVAGDNSSRLYRELVAEKKLAVQIFSLDNALEQDGVLLVAAVLSPLAAKPDAVAQAIADQIERARSEPVTPQELTKARNQMQKELVERSLTAEGKATALGSAAVLEGGPDRVNRRFAEIEAATADDLLRVAKKYLAPEKALILRVPGTLGGAGESQFRSEDQAPITAAAETNPPRPGRAGVSRPSGGLTQPPIAPPAVAETEFLHERFTLDNGLEVIVVPNHEVPYVNVTLGLLAGAWTETKPGTAALALGMLTKGTEKLSEAQLADELGTYAIALDGTGGMDASVVSMNCLAQQLERGMNLLGQVVLAPTFPPDEFDKLQQQVHTALTVQANQPEYIAARELRRGLYGDHPYARTASGEPADVEAINVDDVRQWWQRFARPDMAVLILAGDVDRATAEGLAKANFGAWQAHGPKPEIELPPIPAPRATQIVLVDRPTATQSQVQVGQLAITRRDPRWPTARVVSGYFGGAFNSRLNSKIRVEKGLTYGARGGYQAQRDAGQFSIGTFSKTDSTAETVATVLEEINRLRSEPPSTGELTDTQSYLLGSFPLGRETPIEIANDLWLIESQDLPADFFRQELEGISRTTAADCQRLVDQTVSPESLLIVVVGKAKELKEPLEKIAPVTVIEHQRRSRNNDGR